ncbi:MFS transporter [Candidatus Formimonas warabiya]|uniref:Major facilitator superfamily (MFS) profile domain-containing protein n=1 Tax=Formimonas warabiya TaxID=1761012 RepID=A0A3G1KX39_FORW1|nr:MFS transporter [Candidatus Formimonas warabiya]ATW27058.1 hypothetical protein DCMF_21890 [Candidatus Formimonas warabiya]
MNSEQAVLTTDQAGQQKHRANVFLFLTGSVFSFVTFYSSMTILPLYVYELGGTEFDTGVQTTLFYLASVLMRFYFGPLTDRKGRKIPLLIGAFAFSTSSLLFIFCDSVWTLTLARIYNAIGLASFFSSGGSLMADLAPPNRVGTYIGLYRLTYVLALLAGPLLALSVIKAHSFQAWFLISFLIGLVSLILVCLVKTPGKSTVSESGSLSRFKTVLQEKAAYPVFMGIALTSIAYGVLLTFAVLYISKYTQIANPGIYFTFFSLVGIAGNLGSGYLSDRFGREVIVWPSVILIGIGVGILFFLPWVPIIFLISSIATGIGFSGGLAALAAWLVDVTSKDNRGTVIALQESTIDTSIGLGSFVFGAMSGWMGMGGSFAIIGGAVFLLGLVKIMGRRPVPKTD